MSMYQWRENERNENNKRGIWKQKYNSPSPSLWRHSAGSSSGEKRLRKRQLSGESQRQPAGLVANIQPESWQRLACRPSAANQHQLAKKRIRQQLAKVVNSSQSFLLAIWKWLAKTKCWQRHGWRLKAAVAAEKQPWPADWLA